MTTFQIVEISVDPNEPPPRTERRVVVSSFYTDRCVAEHVMRLWGQAAREKYYRVEEVSST